MIFLSVQLSWGSVNFTPAQYTIGSNNTGLLDWPRTSRDPFEGQWELLLSLVLTHPEWSGGDLFQEIQRLFPGRYRPSHQRTLQGGLRKIRARLLNRLEEPWPEEVIQGRMPDTVSAGSEQREQEADQHAHACAVPSAALRPVRVPQEHAAAPSVRHPSPAKEATKSTAVSAPPAPHPSGDPRSAALGQTVRLLDASLPQAGEQEALQASCPVMMIERAISSYLQEQRAHERRFKTMEWHQTALNLFQQYLVRERHLSLLCQITVEEARGWGAFLQNTPSAKDTPRSACTIATYMRSARAFCHWGVRNGHLQSTPFVKGTIPKVGRKTIQLIDVDEFERLLRACQAEKDGAASGERATLRNRAILWVFLDTGMRVSELCALRRLGDVDRGQRALRVQSTRGTERWVALSPHGWDQVLSYLEQDGPKKVGVQQGSVEGDHLFLSEWYQPLTSNGITLLCDRLKKRAGIREKPVSPSVLRDTFAVRFLQTGEELNALGSVLDLRDTVALKRYGV